ncbi:MAG: hypothetical protein LAN63_17950 [Acidobacteriia bacterium]|nr:hypothetical protein [Terriglobia bacterium]
MQIRIHSAVALASVIVIVAASLSSAAFLLQVPVGAQLSANILAPNVQGSIDLNNPGGEAFWSQLTGAQLPLTASNEFGGNVKSATVKIATNGSDIFTYVTWTDPTESRLNKPLFEDENYPGFFYANQTYNYEDRIVFWWSLDSTPGPPPCMTDAAPGAGEGRSLAGTGNLWHWKSARTDSQGTLWGKLKFGSGPDIGQLMPYTHSYLDNEFINATGHYQLGYDQYPDSFTIGSDPNHAAYDTYLVSAHGAYDSSSHTWKWVASRKLVTTPSLYVQQFAPGRLYYFAVAVFDGGPIPIPQGVNHPAGWTMYGENGETKSISTWYTMALSQGAAATTATGTVTAAMTGISFETAAIVSFGMLIVGFVAGLIVISKFALPKKKS